MSEPPFCGRVPHDRLYDASLDMWVKLEGGLIRIGTTAFGAHLAGKIVAFTAKPRGARVEVGRGLGTVECAKTVLAVRAPVSFELIEANEMAEEQGERVGLDPYGTGWMVLGRPTDWAANSGRLVSAAAYREHVLQLEPGARFDD